MAREKVLLLGGTRFIGPAIVRNLIEKGHLVTVFHRGLNQADLPPGVVERLGDRNVEGELSRLVQETAPDVVIDTFAMTEEAADRTLTELGTWNGRLTMLSSCDVYRNFGGVLGLETEPPSPLPITEESPVRTIRYPYKSDPPRLASDPQAWRDRYDKIPVEAAYLAAGATVLRLPMVFGPGDYQHRMAAYLRRMFDNRPFILLAQELFDYVFPRGFIENVAEAVAVAALSEARSEVFNVADAQGFTEPDWLRRIAAVVGWNGRIEFMPNEHLPEPLKGPLDYRYGIQVSSQKLREQLHVREVVTPDDAISRCVEWERNNMPDVPTDYSAEDRALLSK